MRKYKMIILSLFVLFIIPTFVSAKSYKFNDFENEFSNIAWPDSSAPTLKKGDIIDFSDHSSNVTIFFEDVADNNCYGNAEGCKTTYTLSDDSMIFVVYYNELVLLKAENNIIDYADLVDGHVYKSGDVISNPSMYYDAYYDVNKDGTCNYYKDSNGDSLFSNANFSSKNYCVQEGLVTKLPKYGNKDIMWKLSIVDGALYSPYYLFFEPYDYKAPVFKLTCDRQSINYGEKAKCSVTANAIYELKDVSFDLSTPNFKVSNPTGTDNVKKVSGSREFNFTINNGSSLINKEFTLMTFNLEATKNEVYVDDVAVVDILYTDDLYSGEYEMLKSDLKVIPNSSNPKTYRNTLLLTLPILLLMVTMLTLKLRGEKKKKI